MPVKEEELNIFINEHLVGSLYKYITFFNAHGCGTHKLQFRYVVEIKDRVQCRVQTLELSLLLHKNQTLANHYEKCLSWPSNHIEKQRICLLILFLLDFCAKVTGTLITHAGMIT